MLLEHKPDKGRVDLTFNKYTPDALKRRVPNLPLGVRLEIAGQSTALRIAVPLVDHLQPFSKQEDEVLSALAAVERLLALGRQIAGTASSVAHVATGGSATSAIGNKVDIR
jgi:hypothetical protein